MQDGHEVVDGAAARVQNLLEQGASKEYDTLEEVDDEDAALGWDGKVIQRKHSASSAVSQAIATCVLIILLAALGMVLVMYTQADASNQVNTPHFS